MHMYISICTHTNRKRYVQSSGCNRSIKRLECSRLLMGLICQHLLILYSAFILHSEAFHHMKEVKKDDGLYIQRHVRTWFKRGELPIFNISDKIQPYPHPPMHLFLLEGCDFMMIFGCNRKLKYKKLLGFFVFFNVYFQRCNPHARTSKRQANKCHSDTMVAGFISGSQCVSTIHCTWLAVSSCYPLHFRATSGCLALATIFVHKYRLMLESMDNKEQLNTLRPWNTWILLY